MNYAGIDSSWLLQSCLSSMDSNMKSYASNLDLIESARHFLSWVDGIHFWNFDIVESPSSFWLQLKFVRSSSLASNSSNYTSIVVSLVVESYFSWMVHFETQLMVILIHPVQSDLIIKLLTMFFNSNSLWFLINLDNEYNHCISV